jgi:hypothetical protein
MKASEVFTPGATPSYTYYDRSEKKLEEQLLQAIETKGFITSISGPSKCGKTVLCESVLGRQKDRMLLIPGGGIKTDAQFWNQIRSHLAYPNSTQVQRSTQNGESAALSSAGTIGSTNVASLSSKSQVQTESNVGSLQVHTYDGFNGPQLLENIREKSIRLVVDDFHYIEPEVQKSLAQQFKEAARQGNTIVLVSITQRSDQAIRANPDLRGRLMTIDIPFWTQDELKAIPRQGFKVLNVHAHEEVVNVFERESLGSPQLMQALCLALCRYWKLEDPYPELRKMTCPTGAAERFLKETAALANCKTVYDMLKAGPPVHGSPRNQYNFRDATSGDVYGVLLRAVPVGEPKLSLNYNEIMERVEKIVAGSQPTGASVESALKHLHGIASKKINDDRVLEWDAEKKVLNVLDPYFLYYLRWSGISGGI